MTNDAQPSLTIREARADDAALILHFVRELARYERAEHEVVGDAEMIRASLFEPEAVAHALIGEVDQQAAGFAVYFFNYSTWQARKGLYLEDLYVTPEQRGSGLGKALLQHLAGIAVATDCGRFEWSVLDWNESAIEFYLRMGAVAQDEWTRYRLSGPQLEAVARGLA